MTGSLSRERREVKNNSSARRSTDATMAGLVFFIRVQVDGTATKREMFRQRCRQQATSPSIQGTTTDPAESDAINPH